MKEIDILPMVPSKSIAFCQYGGPKEAAVRGSLARIDRVEVWLDSCDVDNELCWHNPPTSPIFSGIRVGALA